MSQQSLLDATQPKGRRYYWKSEFLPGITSEILGKLREHSARVASPHSAILIFPVDGHLNTLPANHSAVGNRDAKAVFNIQGSWERPEDDAVNIEWARSAWRDIRQFSTGGTYVNFLTEEEGDDRTRAAYGANYDRLVEVKTTWDPDNVFSSNRNIRPVTTLNAARKPRSSARSVHSFSLKPNQPFHIGEMSAGARREDGVRDVAAVRVGVIERQRDMRVDGDVCAGRRRESRGWCGPLRRPAVEAERVRLKRTAAQYRRSWLSARLSAWTSLRIVRRLDRPENQFAERIDVVHQVEERHARIDARGWQHLEKRAVLVVCGIAVAGAE